MAYSQIVLRVFRGEERDGDLPKLAEVMRLLRIDQASLARDQDRVAAYFQFQAELAEWKRQRDALGDPRASLAAIDAKIEEATRELRREREGIVAELLRWQSLDDEVRNAQSRVNTARADARRVFEWEGVAE